MRRINLSDVTISRSNLNSMSTSRPMSDFSTSAGQGDDQDPYTNAMMYGYGTASVAIISCLQLLGITLFPTLKSRINEYLVQFFIALGVSTMTADALLHIIPEALGLHAHGSSEETHEEDHDETSETEILWKMSVVYAGIFLLFVFENGLKVWKTSPKPASSPEDLEAVGNLQTKKSSQVTSFANKHAIENDADSDKNIVEKEDEDIASNKDSIICWRFTTVMLTIFTGDLLCTFADGMAIGISYATSATAGIATAIAVLCHEVPRAYGDFAIYLKNGASKWQAVGLNVSATCFAFVGLYVGIAASNNTTARQWLLAVVAGVFLYIALVLVMVRLTLPEKAHNRTLVFSLQLFGLLLGWTVLLLLGLYEEDIESSLG